MRRLARRCGGFEDPHLLDVKAGQTEMSVGGGDGRGLAGQTELRLRAPRMKFKIEMLSCHRCKSPNAVIAA